MSKLRNKIEARYIIAEVKPAEIDAGIKEILKKVAKKSLQVMLGLGIMSSAAHGMNFNKKNLDAYIKTVNDISKEENMEVKAAGAIKEVNGVQHVEIRFTAADGSSKTIKYVKTNNGEHVNVYEKKVDGNVDSNVEFFTDTLYKDLKKDLMQLGN